MDDGLHISGKQMRAIHATFRDIAEFTGNPDELTKTSLKLMYAKAKGIDYFSFADLTMTAAGEFLDWLTCVVRRERYTAFRKDCGAV